MKQKRAYLDHYYPTLSQRHMLARTFGRVRFVYNRALALRRDAYREPQKHLYYSNTSTALISLKQQEAPAFLNEVSSAPPQQALAVLNIKAEGLSAFASGGRVDSKPAWQRGEGPLRRSRKLPAVRQGIPSPEDDRVDVNLISIVLRCTAVQQTISIATDDVKYPVP